MPIITPMDNDRLNKLQKLLESSPKDSFLLFAIAKEYEAKGNIDLALKYYLELKENDAQYVGLYYHLAKLYETINEDILALQTYGDGIEVAKSQGDFHALSELNNAKMNLEITLGN